MEDLSLHVLDIAENSIRAGAGRITIRIKEDRSADRLLIEIEDDGKGMDDAERQRVLDPFFSTKEKKRVGLGLPLFAMAARECGGSLTVDSAPGRGTRVAAVFRPGHIDCKPLGDMDQTVRVLRVTHPEIEVRYEKET